ncbi:sulfatase-like hydrolase/transferase [Methylomonas sp. EFPC1]|uniref:sulfatase family protein n=1 Tax=Methylomonas sp. EFPC1 TaxID=2812647 RepID=UPI001967B0BE|nr:sulfatase-like hydrolase/transferase [Methylomonas sp. EFPC1]QSB02778.1 sulfatase-like hydrolase/transferase [Methylomonas sp. EFPC1]
MEKILVSLYCSSASALLFTITLIILTLHNYSRTGPGIQKEIEKKFGYYVIFALTRLAAWLFVIFFLTSLPGSIAAYSLSKLTTLIEFNFITGLSCCLISTTLITTYFFLHQLLYTPGTIQLSFQYRFSRLFVIWKILSPKIISGIKFSLISLLSVTSVIALFLAIEENNTPLVLYIIALAGLYAYIYYATIVNEPAVVKASSQTKPNVIMIGSDTLRHDRLGGSNYHRNLTPNIDKLSANGLRLDKCITPVARTAPSIASLFTGLWPHNHKIRDNYPSLADCKLPQPSLIDILNEQGYLTACISDWCGADFAKLSFNFKEISVAEDQWNIKLLLRQGPSLIRNVLSLFTNNALGKRFLPEFYYLAGVPLIRSLSRECRQLIAHSAKNSQPFFINLFTSATHVPFNSEYPYYNLFTPKDYKGESRFIMTRLASAEEIIKKQEKTSEFFDIPQIINLYDSCVKQFDDEVGKIIDYIEKSDLSDNTIVIIYSDHGADFFETGCWGQGNTLVGNDPSGRIPLVMKGPGVPGGVNFKPTTRSIDVMPTLLDLLNITIPTTLDGVNLIPYVKAQTSPELFAFQETGIWLGKIPGLHPEQILYPNIVELLDIPDKKSGTLVVNEKHYPTVIRAKSRSVQNEKWKLIYIATYTKPVYQLYDLENDPYRDVIESHPDIFAELKKLLDSHIESDPLFESAN